MQIVGLSKKVSIYIGEKDKWGHKSLYMAILERLKEEGCAGATVMRGLAGFGVHHQIHTASFVSLSSELPLIIEWVDSPERVKRLMPQLKKMVKNGLITVQEVEVVSYAHRHLRGLPTTMAVWEIMSREVHSVRPDTPLVEAVKLLLDKVYRTLPVVDETNQVVGILTEGNLLSQAEMLSTSVQRSLTEAEMAQELQRLQQEGLTVGDLMTPNPITVTDQMIVPDAINLMVEHRIKRLPVVDKNDKLQGIISRVDILHALAQPGISEVPRQDPPLGRSGKVEDIMMTNVPTVLADASLAEVVGLLVSSVRRRVMVMDDEQRLVGLITDGDLMERATATERSDILHTLQQRLRTGEMDHFHLHQRTAAEVMTKQPVTVGPEDSLLKALNLLLTHQIKRLPVVNEQGQLIGLVGRAGILQALKLA